MEKQKIKKAKTKNAPNIPPKRPALNFLKGSTVIPEQVRVDLGIEPGMLIAEVKKWCVLEQVVQDYIDITEVPVSDPTTFYSNILNALAALNTYDNPKNQLPQEPLFKDYSSRISSYLKHNSIKSTLIYLYAKRYDHKRKEQEKATWRIQENHEHERLKHNVTMNAYLATESESIELGNHLQDSIQQQKQKRKLSEDVDDNVDDGVGDGVGDGVDDGVGDGVDDDVGDEVEEDDGSKVRRTDDNAASLIRDNSFTSESTGTIYEDKGSPSETIDPTIAFVMSMDELEPITELALANLKFAQKNVFLDERLSWSSIAITPFESSFLPSELGDDIEKLIKKFTRAVEYNNKEGMLLTPTSIEHINIISLLNTSFTNILKEGDLLKYNYQYYRSPDEQLNMENNYKIKFIVPFINSAFHVGDQINVDWDCPLEIYNHSNMTIQTRQTPDIRFTTVDGLEIGLGEIKPFNAPEEDIEKDRIRLAEISKKMLHRRVLQAKTKSEFKIFCIMFYDYSIEYYVHEFDHESDADHRYLFKSVKKSTIPTFPKTFSSMALSLESLFHFKSLIEDSLPSLDQLESPYPFADINDLFEPTVTLIKLDNDE